MPIIDGFDDESIQTVGHLGIVTGAYDSLLKFPDDLFPLIISSPDSQ
jgi:hypothetical protein